jgi:hypothetical protein
MNWIGQKLELQIIIIKPNLIIQDSKRIGSVALQRITIPIIPGQFEIGMRSRSDPQNNGIFRIAPIHDPIRRKPGFYIKTYRSCLVNNIIGPKLHISHEFNDLT